MTDSDPLDFIPAPCSTRHDGWTAERQRLFIATLAEHGGVAHAARAVGMTPQTANRLRAREGAEDFARAWDVALSEGRQRSYDEAVRRGKEGHLVPIMRNGRVIGHRRRVDSRLLYAACYAERCGGRDDGRRPSLVPVCRNLRNLRAPADPKLRRTAMTNTRQFTAAVLYTRPHHASARHADDPSFR